MEKKEKRRNGFWLIKGLLFLGLVVLAYISYSIFKVAYRKNQVQKEISSLEGEAARIERENSDLRDKISYFESRDFQEKEVRDKLSLQEPSENLVIVKPEPGKGKQKELQKEPAEASKTDSTPLYKKWWNYFFKY
jgi:cell division protein FtsB